MDLVQIEAFLVLFEEQHFGNASQRLYVSQPMISRRIASLEQEIGGALFERSSRKVRPTPLGAELEARLRPAHVQMLAALEAARASARGTTGALRVGVRTGSNRPAVTGVVQLFQRTYPECPVSIEEVDSIGPYDALRRGEVDVLCDWLAVDEPDLTVGPIMENCERVLATCADHRLAARPSVSIEDVAKEVVHRPPKGFPQALGDAILPPRTPSDRPIRRAEDEVKSFDHLVSAVAQGKFVAPAMQGMSIYTRADIKLIPITDLPPLPLGLIWCTAHENARIRAFADLARNLTPSETPTRPATPAVR